MKISNNENDKKSTYRHELYIRDYTSNGLTYSNPEHFSFEDYEKTKITPKKGEKILSKESYTESFYKKLLKDVFNEDSPINDLKVGSIIEGMLHTIDEKNAYIDINFKDSVVVDRREIEKYQLHVGQRVEVLITQYENRQYNNLIQGSVMMAMEQGFMTRVEDYIRNQTPLEFLVIQVNDGGFNLKLNESDLYFFMPNFLAGVNKLPNPKELLGTTLTAVIESNIKETNTFIVSRRKYLESMIDDKLKSLKYNQSYNGKVTGTAEYGVFVEFEECLTCLIHKTNLHPDNQARFETIVAGMDIEFLVKDIFRNDKKIIGTQIIRESLWDSIQEGQIVTGEVASIKNIGILVKLDDETKGLISESYVKKYKLNYKVGQVIDVKVENVNKEKRKITLNIVK